METSGHAFGKLILLGEHAVVHGIPAIALGIDRGATARARALTGAGPSRLRVTRWAVETAEDDEGDLGRALAALLASVRARGGLPPLAFEATTDLPAGGGLGCSAALGVAVARAAVLQTAQRATDDDVGEHAMAWERVFHGNPSGIDAAVAARGGAFQFVRSHERSVIEPIVPLVSLVFAIGHSGAASATRTMVEAVARQRADRPAATDATFAHIGSLVRDARRAIEAGDHVALGKLLDQNQTLLASLSLSTKAIDALCASAREAGALGAKLTGAGGGGCVLALAESRAGAERILSSWKARSFDGFVAELHAQPRVATTVRTSRLPGFYKVDVEERRALVGNATGADPRDIARSLAAGGLDAETADKFVENVIGTYALPYGVALNVRVNGHDHVVPMVIEEPSVVAAASNAAKMIREGGGFIAEMDPPLMVAQVQLTHVRDRQAAIQRVLAAKDEILGIANRAVPGLVERGGGARDFEMRVVGTDADAMLVAHVLVDCRDAMGANLVNAVAERVAPRLAELSGGSVGLRILSNLCDRRCVRVHCHVPASALATDDMDGAAVIDGIVNASRFAELDPYRAATHNKGIMNGIDAVTIATGNDWRAVEAGAHAFASRSGRYSPLATWRRSAQHDVLVGHIELPMALGTVGGTLRVHPAARLSLQLLGVTHAHELAAIAAAVGLASNLAALRALATDGIQRGHMALHARSVAVAAGAIGDEVERVATMIVEARDITLDAAQRALSQA